MRWLFPWMKRLHPGQSLRTFSGATTKCCSICNPSLSITFGSLHMHLWQDYPSFTSLFGKDALAHSHVYQPHEDCISMYWMRGPKGTKCFPCKFSGWTRSELKPAGSRSGNLKMTGWVPIYWLLTMCQALGKMFHMFSHLTFKTNSQARYYYFFYHIVNKTEVYRKLSAMP